jgi:hypothetical protein
LRFHKSQQQEKSSQAKSDRRNFGLHLVEQIYQIVLGYGGTASNTKEREEKRTCGKKKEKRGETSKKPGENLIRMKTNKVKTVKAHAGKKNAKNLKDKKAPGEEQIFNKEKGTKVINIKKTKKPIFLRI